jgi:hypothetical protein
MNNEFNLNQQKIRRQKIRRQNKIMRQKIRQQKIKQQQIRLRQIIYQILPLLRSGKLEMDKININNNKIIIPKYNVKFYNNLNSNINSNKTIIHVLQYTYGIGDYLRGSIFLAQCAKFFNIKLELDLSQHNISNCIENKNEMRNIDKPIHTVFWAGDDNNYSDKFKLLLLINKFKKSKNTKLYITSNLPYNINGVSSDITDYINSCFKFKKFYYDDVNKFFNLKNYNVLHIRCNDNYFDCDFNDQTLITKIIELRLNKNTLVISNNYSLKQKLNKLFGFYLVDSKAVHTVNASNNLNDLYSTIIEYIMLSKSSQTYCFSYYGHGSGFSEQCSVLNYVPYTAWYIPSDNIITNYIATPQPDCGIGSVIVNVISALYYLKENNINAVLTVNCINASEPVKVFIDYFLDKDNIKYIKFVNIYDDFYKINNNEANIYKELFHVNETKHIYDTMINDNNYFNKCLEIFNNLWILKPFVKNMCVSLEQYDICINIRRGDKLTLEPHLSIASIDAYINEINKINITNPKIFHTSDEYNSFLEIKTKNVDWNISTLTSPEENGYFLRDINKKDRQYSVNHVEKFMKQLYIMKNSEYFIGSISTNVGYLVKLLRQVNNDEKNIYFS